MSENSPTRTSVPQPEAEPETLTRVPDSVPGLISEAGVATGSVADSGPKTADDLVPERIGDYLVVRKIGEGGMGSVYLAEDPKLGRKAAVKTMRLELAARKENRDRFVREARAAAAVEHDNIVPIWGIGEAADGSPYIAMPFLQGEMLDARLKRERVSPVALVLAVGRDVADGLAAAHARNLVHRDIKPANIWLEGDPAASDRAKQVRRAKVLDFGLARSVDQQDTQLTATGAVLGTPSFMAPEQARGDTVDHRADLWSLGVTLYRMATGRLPFGGANTMAVLYALASETPSPVCELNPAVPPALGALIDQLMQKDAALRPQTAEEVAERLRQILGDQTASAASRSIPVVVLPDAGSDPWGGVTEPDAGGPAVVRAHEPKPRPKPNPLLPAVGVVALAALCVLLAVVVIKFQTAEGTLTVEITDPEVEARFKGGRLVLVGADGKERYTITPSERNKTVDAGKYTVRVEGADGLALDTSEFTLKKKGEVVVRVTLDPKKVAKKDPPKKEEVSADRQAAEWVLSAGGKVRADGDENWLGSAGALPRQPFRLTGVDLKAQARVTNADLARLKECSGLTYLVLEAPLVTDAGLNHFAGCKDLIGLDLYGTPVTGAGFGAFKECRELRFLHLGGSRVTDAGLEHFRDCTKITDILLGGTPVTDAGLAHFQKSLKLRTLMLNRTQVTDAGLAHFKDQKGLETLNLHAATQVTDAGLAHFRGCDRLMHLNVQGTKATAEGVKAFAKAMPRCKIEWDGGTIEPTEKEPDRKAAEWVLSIGGEVYVNGVQTSLKAIGDLPRDTFRLTHVQLGENKHVTDAGLVNLKDCRNLLYVALHGTRVTDAGLVHFKEHTSLTHVGLGSTKLTDAGLANFQNCKQLVQISADDTAITDTGLALFKDHKRLAILTLGDTRVTDAGLVNLKGLPAMWHLQLQGTGVTDAGLANLAGLDKLKELRIFKTKVTEKGATELARALPRCKIIWDGGTVEPTEKK